MLNAGKRHWLSNLKHATDANKCKVQAVHSLDSLFRYQNLTYQQTGELAKVKQLFKPKDDLEARLKDQSWLGGQQPS